MKRSAFFLACVILTTASCTSRPASNEQAPEHSEETTINCLNEKIDSPYTEFTSFELIEETDSSLVKGIKQPINYRRFSSSTSLNRLDFIFTIEYYYGDAGQLSILEKDLIDQYSDIIAEQETKLIERVGEFVVCVSVSKGFDDSFSYLKDIMYRLLLGFVNECSPCR